VVDVKNNAPVVKANVQNFVNALNVADSDGKLAPDEERALKNAFKAMSPEDRAAAMEMARNSGHAALAAHLDPASMPKPGMKPAERKELDAFMKDKGVPEAQRGPMLDAYDKLDPSARKRQKEVLTVALEGALVGGSLKGEAWKHALKGYQAQLKSLADGTPVQGGASAQVPPPTRESVQKESQARDAERVTAREGLVKEGGTAVVYMQGVVHAGDPEADIPRYVLDDANAENAGQAAVKSRQPNQPAEVAASNGGLGQVKANLDGMAAERARKGLPDKDFAREVYLLGHGEPGAWIANQGGKKVDAASLKGAPTGTLSHAMANGGTVTLGGCYMAQGDKGRALMFEMGRLFFGEGKTGYIRGGTVKTNDPLHPLQQVVLKWPDDFQKELAARKTAP
jgi:hypothetical protein